MTAIAAAGRAPATLPAAEPARYRIQAGDTLSQIAARHGVGMDALLAANPQIRNPDHIEAGDWLHLPAGAQAGAAAPRVAEPTLHTVRPGETLSQLARSHHTTVGALARANGIANPDRIQVGQVLRLAGGAPGQAAPAPGGNGGGGGDWMRIARGELGQREIAGAAHNPRIVAYHQTTSLRASNDETPWCASFVNWAMEKAGHKGTGSAAAIS